MPVASNLPVHLVTRLLNVRIPMRDGVELAADIALPPGPGPFPAVLHRPAYSRSWSWVAPWTRLVDSGYALVSVDVRGRGDSDGDFNIWEGDGLDGYDVIEWIAGQPWCTGKIGMIGVSYGAITQWHAAVTRPPHLTCMVPISVGVVRLSGAPYTKGAIQLSRIAWMQCISGRSQQYEGAVDWERVVRHTPVRELDQVVTRTKSPWKLYMDGTINHCGPQSQIPPELIAELDLPVLFITGLFDHIAPFPVWEAVRESKGADKLRLLLGPWDHGGNKGMALTLGGFDFRPAWVDIPEQWLRFFDHWLKGVDNGLDEEPPMRVFRSGANYWESLADWPPREAPIHTLWLASGDRSAVSLAGDGVLRDSPSGTDKADSYVYDPASPTLVLEGTKLPYSALSDHRYIERRPDCVVYTSAPLDRELCVSGKVQLRIWFSTDRPDTDVIGWVSDVHPDGRSIWLGQDVTRLRYRNFDGKEALLSKDEVVTITLDLVYLHHSFQPRHRIRVGVMSSMFPYLDRNLNGSEHPADQTTFYPARNSVHHGHGHESCLFLPLA